LNQSGLTISFCIVCMNRLHHLQQTFLKNINDNMGYEQLEFVLLDYNSQDGMEEWVKENLSQHISSGKVSYYKTFEPSSFKHSHAKNLALKLASNNIVCSINADHFAGVDFAHYVNECFVNNDKIVLTPIPTLFFKKDKDYPPGDIWGLVCVQKEDFLKIRGFDERMINYGNEDIDFIHRLEMLHIKRAPIKRSFLSGFIAHSDQERHLFIRSNKLYAVYALYISPALSEFIFLYKDKTFEKIIITDNLATGSDDYRLSFMPRNVGTRFSFENAGNRGHWEDKGNTISFSYEIDTPLQLLKEEGVLRTSDGDTVYTLLKEPEIMEYVFNFYYFGFNTSIMQQNINDKTFEVNPNGFGRAVVFRNFDYDNAIYV
jgi:hypothetical protein